EHHGDPQGCGGLKAANHEGFRLGLRTLRFAVSEVGGDIDGLLDSRLAHGFAPLPPSNLTDLTNASKAAFCLPTNSTGPVILKNQVRSSCGRLTASMRVAFSPPVPGPTRSR